MYWLLEEHTKKTLELAPPPTSEQTAMALAAFGPCEQQTGRGRVKYDADRIMTVVGDRAQIDVVGVTTSSIDIMAMIFGMGNTLYGDIVASIYAAEADSNIKAVDFFFNSPGGEALPVLGVGDLIRDMRKPTTARVESANSAAYWMASQCNRIVANSRGASVGSIGAAMSVRKPSESMYVELSSTNAPKKRPNPETAEGVNSIRESLDTLHLKFAEAVAQGRGTTVENVNATFGQGASLLADQALAAGMIDEIAQAPTQSVSGSSSDVPSAAAQINKPDGGRKVDLATLKTDYPNVFAQAFAEGEIAGKAAELDRIKFHAVMGAKTGAEAYALKACSEGTPVNSGEAQAEYMSCGFNKTELNARQNDENVLAANKPAAATDEAREKAKVVDLFNRVGVAIAP